MTPLPEVLILAPAGAVSGGPEALHQLCDALRRRGVDARIHYYGSGTVVPTPLPYRRYDIALAESAAAARETLVVVPEVIAGQVTRFRHARPAIWWLSVDNFFKWRHLSPGFTLADADPRILHLCQSHYARTFLARAGITRTLMLTDYVADELARQAGGSGRIPAIAFNPKKGAEVTRRLMDAGGPDWTWLALENLSREEMAARLRQARLYIDFGPHPGCDRIPREAALAGAVVVSGRRGAAAFTADLPLPDRFKLDEADPDFLPRALDTLGALLRSDTAFQEAQAQQACYCQWAAGGRERFLAEVDVLIAEVLSPVSIGSGA